MLAGTAATRDPDPGAIVTLAARDQSFGLAARHCRAPDAPKVSRAFHAALTLDIQHILDQAVVSLGQRVSPTNVVFLHDPPTVGLAPALTRLGATVVWSYHVDADHPNELAQTAWDWLRPVSTRSTRICSPALPAAGRAALRQARSDPGSSELGIAFFFKLLCASGRCRGIGTARARALASLQLGEPPAVSCALLTWPSMSRRK